MPGGAPGASDLGTGEGASVAGTAPGETEWPAASTIGALFDREGLTVKRRLRRRSPPSSAPFGHCGAANDVWCIDFKGWFLTGDGTHCEPLTLSDAHSRYLLRCQALARTDTDHVWPVLDAAFREFGLPHRLRSDNGPPFASRGAGGLSQAVGQGDQGRSGAGAHRAWQAAAERSTGAAASDAAAGHRQPAGAEPARAARALAQLPGLYNEERPHAALANDTPAEHYAVSPRRFDGVLREPGL